MKSLIFQNPYDFFSIFCISENFFQNFEKWIERYELCTYFRNKISYHTQKLSGWLNPQFNEESREEL